MHTYKPAINNGIFLGLALIACSFALYQANPLMFVGAESSMLIFVLILILFKTGTELRRANKGVISFMPAFKHMFITGAIAALLCTTFEYILYNFIDPDLIEIQRKIELERFEVSKKVFSSKFDPILEQTLDEIKNKNSARIDKQILKYLIRLVAPIGFFASFIALIIRRDKSFSDKKPKV